MEEHDRLLKINYELNKLNFLIEKSQQQNNAVLQLLNDCQHSSPSSSSSVIIDQRSKSRSLSEMFQGTDSKHSVFLSDNQWADSFDFNECSSIIKKQSKKSSKKISNIFEKSNFSTQSIKGPQIQKLQPKNASTGIKKTKLQKSNIPKSKGKFMEKEKILCEQQKGTKITQIKSEKKLLNNNKSSLKYSLNLNTIAEQKTSVLKKQKLSKNAYQTAPETQQIHLHKAYASTKMQTLNSKRSKAKHSSMVNKQKILQQMNTMRNSNHKYQIELQKQVHSKIKGLKLKKNLCEVEGNYLKVAMRVTKEEIDRALVCLNQCEEENMIRFFILKTVMKFVFQIKNQAALNFEPLVMNEVKSEKTLKKCEKFIKTIHKLPEILSKSQQISQFSYKELTEQKMFIQQKISNLSSTQSLTKQILFVYLQELYEFISFLLKNNFISLTKSGDKVPFISEGFYSDRSAKRQVDHPTKQNDIFIPKKKEFSQRKHEKNIALKRTNTTKALKKSTTAVKPRLV